MDLKELTSFQTIIQEGTFSKAAQKLNYAQSTITNQIQRLEKELGIQLFKRGWEAELTDSGRLFAAEIDKLIQHWNYVTEQAKALQKEEIGTIAIGAIELLASQVLPNSLRRFQEHKPLVSCQMVIANTDTLSNALLQDQLHFAICGEPMESAAFYFEPLFHEQITFIVHEDHPLAFHSGIAFPDLMVYPLIVGGRTCLYHRRLSSQLSRYSTTPLMHTVSQISAIPNFVQQLPMVGAVLDSTPLPPGLTKLTVEWTDHTIPVGLLQLRNHAFISTSQTLLMEIIKDEIQAFYPS
ncbi:LysR family transcriptional regulator [Paenibacillus selenitireducens]|uniref:LysR family transcriptional regulator n=1 Tax=Paenibacillus selenitireducens TaxID=1324314 RepID=A0A1T2XM78_9BACL|nr:LysR family transcriptional regulator [Paenibacillus selenitireducens]OPA80967.1 LysR family transcriptional regulator [Paenibacillus selenitireducens]